ncbi:GFA family protein [Aggregatibacter actinomycetemcomitans]|uniref:GFA family protein n=1 Tax=Aggregatibacter actinomycetemcomitans TaxID=714 RepID=UPI00197C3579|nr:GFA family protein [Aggregatibacter actinomycetemcomitans]MBN6064487.1 GFA family protein [Aggregatibacter actinomycetemcomitans]MBN6080875.1 GFA family protein [Aggregatibacter actinomycetemcomitans]MBN6084536.1 GFA family protein [Aggregatibacter actinomycetemcomitans]
MKGQCLCGAVSISVPANQEVHACHCNMCQRWNGGPLFAFHSEEIEITGVENITCYQSSEWAERAFCKHCGSHLYYHLLGTQSYEISAGLFSAQTDFKLEDEIFIDRKPAFYELKNDVPKLTEAEVMAKYGF